MKKKLQQPLAFLSMVVKAAVNPANLARAGLNRLRDSFAAEWIGCIVDDVQKQKEDMEEDEFRRSIEEMVQADPQLIIEVSHRVVKESKSAANLPPEQQEKLIGWLQHIPAHAREALKNKDDPSGKTISKSTRFEKAEDLLPLFPARMPQLKPGDEPVQGSDYKLVRLLGIGGFGEVWLAHKPFGHPREVAIKFCTDPESRERLLRHEAALSARVNKAADVRGVVPLLNSHLRSDPPCLVYEYVNGGNLAAWLRNRGHFDPAFVRRFIVHLAKSVWACHAAGVVHRDLKPANILLRVGDRGIRPLIADFGIGGISAAAQSQTRQMTDQSQMTHSLVRGAHSDLYASPQQRRGEDAHVGDDIWSLGLIWYQLLTGNLKAGVPSGRKWQQRLVDAGIPQDDVNILEECFESDREDRIASMADLIKRLSQTSSSTNSVANDAEPKVSPQQPAGVRTSPAADPLITNNVGMEFRLIPAGSFLMGSPDSDSDAYDDEKPQHRVDITRPFYLQTTVVTQSQWRAVMRSQRWKEKAWVKEGDAYPAVYTSWEDAEKFCRKLSARDNCEYRLPTEAEWEYACRAGTTTKFSFGDSEELLTDFAWFNANALDVGAKYAHAVAEKQPNNWGLYDMHGNVWEWCLDWYGDYGSANQHDPSWPSEASFRVNRGGSWFDSGRICRSAVPRQEHAVEPETASWAFVWSAVQSGNQQNKRSGSGSPEGGRRSPTGGALAHAERLPSFKRG